MLSSRSPRIRSRSSSAIDVTAPAVKLSEAQAFVLTHAIAGVLRTLASSAKAPPLRQVEDALVLLAGSHLGAVRETHAQ